MPKKVTQKARQLDGMQFDGSYKSAVEILVWVDFLNGNGWWRNGILAINTDAALSYVQPEGWVIRDEEVEFRVLTKEEFNEQFEEDNA